MDAGVVRGPVHDSGAQAKRWIFDVSLDEYHRHVDRGPDLLESRLECDRFVQRHKCHGGVGYGVCSPDAAAGDL